MHGGDVYGKEDITDFSVSLSPLGIPPSVEEALKRAAAVSDRYPDPYCRKLRSAIGESEGIPGSRIVCGAGAAELIYRLVFYKRPRRTLIVAPAFSEYERAARQAGGEVIFCAGIPDPERDLTEDTDMVFLANPSNPAGEITDREELRRLAAKCSALGAVLVVDECFMDFVEGYDRLEAKPLLSEKGSPVVILRSYTKIFSMPGVRLGYALFPDEAPAEKVGSFMQPWSVSAAAQCAGIAAALLGDHKESVRKYVAAERKYLYGELLRIFGRRVWDVESRANYILFDVGEGMADRFASSLESEGFLIRDCSDFHGLSKGHFRIGIRCHRDNEALMKAMEKILG